MLANDSHVKLTKRNAKTIDIPMQDNNRVYNHLIDFKMRCRLKSWWLLEFVCEL